MLLLNSADKRHSHLKTTNKPVTRCDLLKYLEKFLKMHKSRTNETLKNPSIKVTELKPTTSLKTNPQTSKETFLTEPLKM